MLKILGDEEGCVAIDGLCTVNFVLTNHTDDLFEIGNSRQFWLNVPFFAAKIR